MAFYDIFENLCLKKGVTPTQVARDNDIKQSVVAMWKKRGSTPKAETVQKLSDYFGVSTDYLLDLTTLERDKLQYVEDYVVEQTGESRDAVHKRLIEEKISALPYDAYNDAVDAADEAVVEAFRAIPDSQLQKYLLEDYRLLNRRGRIEAVMHTARLTEDYRFNRARAWQEAGNATPLSPENKEGTDTTPPPPPPESP